MSLHGPVGINSPAEQGHFARERPDHTDALRRRAGDDIVGALLTETAEAGL